MTDPFTWYWVDGARWSDDADPTLQIRPSLPYSPLREHPALFLDFAGLDGTPESFEGFALDYGTLFSLWEPETLSAWRNEHEQMADAVGLLNLFQDGRVDLAGRERYRARLISIITAGLSRSDVIPTLRPTGHLSGAGVEIVFRVVNLIGGMWLQLAVAAEGGRKYRTCFCGKSIDITDAPGKKWCSEKCRNKRNYLRRTGRWDDEIDRPTKGGETDDN